MYRSRSFFSVTAPRFEQKALRAARLAALSLLVACSGRPGDLRRIEATVSGLLGSGLVLQLNGTIEVPVKSDGRVTIATVPSGSSFFVGVKRQPTSPDQTCTVENGSGWVTGADITGITIVCSLSAYKVGGNVVGLEGSGLTLQLNDGLEKLVLDRPDAGATSKNVWFTFENPIASGATYEATVFANPTDPTQRCEVYNGLGKMGGTEISNVIVNCQVVSLTVDVTVTGLQGSGFTLQLNGNETRSVTPASSSDAAVAVTFQTKIPSGTPYKVAILSYPTNPAQDCRVENGSGVAGGGETVDVTVTCPNDWHTTGSMTTAREGHTATLLANGKVLIAGGYAEGIFFASAELFDPDTGTFTLIANRMAIPRAWHTATLLQKGNQKGKVLIVGGSFHTDNATAELYDPQTGLFTSIVDASNNPTHLAAPRWGHTATLLPNGLVLIAGGDGGSDLASAELLDPDTGTFTLIATSMTVPRAYHAATLLEDGTVLFTGGNTSGTAELYDPTANAFAPMRNNSTVTARTGLTATRLQDGTVLIAGGYGNTPGADREVLYEPPTSTTGATFNPVGKNMAFRREDGAKTALLPDGKVLIVGGAKVDEIPRAELFDPSQWAFVPTHGDMRTSRRNHTATPLLDGSVLIAGGLVGSTPLASAELYRPSTP